MFSLDRPAVPATVRSWSAEHGWGVVDAPQVPGGCWAHFSVLEVPGARELVPGEGVSLAYEPAEQDGYLYRAIAVRPDRVDPDWRPAPPAGDAASTGLGSASTSTLTITFDDAATVFDDRVADRPSPSTGA